MKKLFVRLIFLLLSDEEASDQNEEYENQENQGEELDSDSEYSEQELSAPTELPAALSDIPNDSLHEVEPPESEEVEEKEPLNLSADDIVKTDVQEAEIKDINDLQEEVSEIDTVKDSLEVESESRKESDSEFKDASGELPDESESKSESKHKDGGVDDVKETDEKEIPEEGTSVDPSASNDDLGSTEVKVEEIDVSVHEEKSDSETEKKESVEDRTKECSESKSESIDSDSVDKGVKIIDPDSNENVIEPTNNEAEKTTQSDDSTKEDI